MVDLRLLHKAMAGVRSTVIPFGLILARPQRLEVEEQRRAARRQAAAASGGVAFRVEAAAWVVAPAVAADRAQAAVIAEKPLS
jgi:hypothetical protein